MKKIHKEIYNKEHKKEKNKSGDTMLSRKEISNDNKIMNVEGFNVATAIEDVQLSLVITSLKNLVVELNDLKINFKKEIKEDIINLENNSNEQFKQFKVIIDDLSNKEIEYRKSRFLQIMTFLGVIASVLIPAITTIILNFFK